MTEISQGFYTVVLPPEAFGLIDSEHTQAQNFLTYLAQKKRIIAFSPHLDDVALSIGSLLQFLADQGKSIEVVSLFTHGSDLSTDFTRKLIAQGNCQTNNEYFSTRRQEDRVALQTVGVQRTKHLGFIDGAWRKKNSGDAVYDHTVIGIPRDPQDDQLLLSVIEKVKTEIIVDKDTAIFAPLGWGGHIDHVLTRDTCAILFPQAIFFADFPYLQKYKLVDDFVKKRQLVTLRWHGNSYEKKAHAILKYTSQLVSLFKENPMQLEYEAFFVPEGIINE